MLRVGLMIMMAVAVPAFAQPHEASGNVVLNRSTDVQIAHAYAYLQDAGDDEGKITVVFTDKVVPEGWDLRQFDTTTPAGVTALVLHMNGDTAEKATFRHASGTFDVNASKMSMTWSLGETAGGQLQLPETTLEDGKSTLRWNIQFELDME
jgi:hypothetical protein